MSLFDWEWPSIGWAHPDMFGLLALIPILALLAWRSSRKRRSALQEWGAPQRTTRIRQRRWGYRWQVLALIVMIVALAGPQWGKTIEPGVIYGRDIIAVLDLSRSMLAEDVMLDGKAAPRWAKARAELQQLANAAQRRGGHRLGLVIFAARAQVIVPLTADYDHFRRKLDELDGAFPPPEILPGPIPPPSGTRIGAAISTAAQMVDPRFPRATDLLLLSDGDDPAADQEWQSAVTAAVAAGTVIDTVGIGTAEGAFIPLEGDQVVEFGQVPVVTKLNPEPLRELARQTGGVSWSTLDRSLDTFFTEVSESRLARELDADALPRPTPRHRWFIGLALVLVLLSILQERSRRMPHA